MTDPTTTNPYETSAPAALPVTNTLAILSLIAAFIFPIVGVVLGHIALNQIAKTGENGRALALAGLIIGYIGISVATFAWLSIFVFVAFIGHLT